MPHIDGGPALMEVPAEHPRTCIGCQEGSAADGPFVQMRFHPGLNWRIYFCADCVKEAAVAAGFLKGKQQDVVLDQSKQVAQRDAEIARLQRRLTKSDKQAKDWETLAGERAAVLDSQRQRIEQLEGSITAISDEAQSKLAVLAASE